MSSNLCRLWSFLLLAISAASRFAAGGEPVALRVDSFLVTPAHTPSAVVHVKNLTQSPYRGTVRLKTPAGWSFKADSQEVSLAPGEVTSLRFVVQRGVAVEENSYPLEAVAVGAGVTVTRQQNVVAASAPYYKPEIDGDVRDWKDAIPVTWTTRDKQTTISTCWNRREFAILVAVEEEQLVPKQAVEADGLFDAVQIAISAQSAPTATTPDGEAGRYEFLVVPVTAGDGCCYRLATPEVKLAETQARRELEPFAFEDAKVAVRRQGDVTYYECSIPWKTMREIRAGEGREFCLSVLVHDPDGTGIRDWGQAAGLWPWQRNQLAWSQWAGAKWGDDPPFESRVPWGMCSSKY